MGLTGEGWKVEKGREHHNRHHRDRSRRTQKITSKFRKLRDYYVDCGDSNCLNLTGALKISGP